MMATDKSANAKVAKADSSKAQKSAPKQSKPSKPSLFTRLGEYLVGVRGELKRVVWPGRQEVATSSVVVLVTLVFFAILTTLVGLAASTTIGLLAQIGG